MSADFTIEIRRTGYGRTEARGLLAFTAEELRDLAHLYGSSDGAYQELLDFADRVDGSVTSHD